MAVGTVQLEGWILKMLLMLLPLLGIIVLDDSVGDDLHHSISKVWLLG